MARGSAPRRAGRPSGRRAPSSAKRPANSARSTTPAPARPDIDALRLGAVPGATPGRWIDTWNERFPHAPVQLIALEVATQRDVLVAGEVDAAIVRLPIEPDGLSVIPLYDELPVVVVSADSHLSAADELDVEDLNGETLITPLDDVLGTTVPGAVAPRFDAPGSTGEAIETVAAGVGIVIVPMSVARAHHRRDVEIRILRGGPTSTVALAWPTAATTPAVEAFIGVVRGRTANSSRS